MQMGAQRVHGVPAGEQLGVGGRNSDIHGFTIYDLRFTINMPSFHRWAALTPDHVQS
jgi:hypothetical protein